MNYEHHPADECPHVFVFDQDWEIRAIKAAYREAIMNRALKGNTSSISGSDADLATYPGSSKVLLRRLRKPEDMTDVLQDFVDNTDEAIARIPDETRVAAFENDKIGKRMKMAEDARMLISEMVQAYPALEMEEGMAEHELSAEEQIEAFRKKLESLPETKDE